MNIFGYYNYRKFLKEYYEYKKSMNRHFSYRAFAQRAGYNSSGLYLDLVRGKKNLTPKLVDKFITALKIKDREKLYFMLMVDFTHAETYQAKQEIFERMAKLLPRSIQKLSRDQRRYYEKWYYAAIRETLWVMNIDTNYQDLALFLSPRISVPKAKEAMRLLRNLDMIEKADGFWRPCNKTIRSGDLADPVLVHNFQKQMIDLGKDSLDIYTKEKRNVSGTTMSVSPMGLERIIHKIDNFRREVIDIVRSDEKENQVYQLNVQFFPLSKEREVE